MASKYKDKAETLVLSGKAMYARLFQPDTHPQYGSKWTVTLLLDQAGREIAEANQLQVKHDPKLAGKFPGYEGYFVRVTRPVNKSKFSGGGPNEPPEVIDVHQAPLDPATLIGDGSDLKVKFIVKNSDAAGIKKWGGKSVWLLKVQVTNLIKGQPRVGTFAPDADFMEDSTEWGTTAATPKAASGSSPFDK